MNEEKKKKIVYWIHLIVGILTFFLPFYFLISNAVSIGYFWDSFFFRFFGVPLFLISSILIILGSLGIKKDRKKFIYACLIGDMLFIIGVFNAMYIFNWWEYWMGFFLRILLIMGLFLIYLIYPYTKKSKIFDLLIGFLSANIFLKIFAFITNYIYPNFPEEIGHYYRFIISETFIFLDIVFLILLVLISLLIFKNKLKISKYIKFAFFATLAVILIKELIYFYSFWPIKKEYKSFSSYSSILEVLKIAYYSFFSLQ